MSTFLQLKRAPKNIVVVVIASAIAACALTVIPFRVASAQQECSVGTTHTGNNAKQSTLPLQMPFLSGELWTVGGGGSFYGNKRHCNSFNDHYATDWNRSGDAGASVLAVANGTVSDIRGEPCPEYGYGCYVQVDHDNGYRTLYGHLTRPADGIVLNTRVKAGTIIGNVGNTGTNGGDPHLHLSFKHFESVFWYSYCDSDDCDASEARTQPQGYRPSPMMTQQGAVTLVDGGSYISINGRIYLPNLRDANNWQSVIRIKNMNSRTQTVARVSLFGSYYCGTQYIIAADQMVEIPASCYGGVANGYVDADQEVAVIVQNVQSSPVAKGAYTGVPASAVWGPVNIPLVAKQLSTASGIANSEIQIENPTTNLANVRVQLRQTGQSGISRDFTVSVNGNSSFRYVLQNDPAVPTNWGGSAVISGGPMAVTSDYFMWSGATDFAFNGYPADNRAESVYIPQFMVRVTGATGIASTPLAIQNLSDNSTTFGPGELRMDCIPIPTIPFTNFTVYNSTAVSVFNTYAFNPVTDYTLFPNSLTGWQGSCKLSIVNQTTPKTKYFVVMAQIRYPANQNASAYDAIRTDAGSTRVFYPIIQKRLGDGSATAAVVQNLGSIAATVTFTYTPASICSNSIVTFSTYIGPGQSLIQNQRVDAQPGTPPDDHLPVGWCGSLTVQSTNGQPIDGFGQITNMNNPTYDAIMSYNAVSGP